PLPRNRCGAAPAARAREGRPVLLAHTPAAPASGSHNPYGPSPAVRRPTACPRRPSSPSGFRPPPASGSRDGAGLAGEGRGSLRRRTSAGLATSPQQSRARRDRTCCRSSISDRTRSSPAARPDGGRYGPALAPLAHGTPGRESGKVLLPRAFLLL